MMRQVTIGLFLILGAAGISHADVDVGMVPGDLSKDATAEVLWKSAVEATVSLMAQPMATPRPTATETAAVKVAAIHDGKWIAFRLRWADPEISEGGPLATFSDAVAIQFPSKSNTAEAPVMMGAKGLPVHIFHWRYMYQLDAEKGMKTIDKIYPNMSVDMYALDPKDRGKSKDVSQETKDSFVGGKAAGNPQSFPKAGVDEIFAEGFGTSAVIENPQSKGHGVWKDGEWTVVIARPLIRPEGSTLEVGKDSFIGFAVWQGGKKEVGSRKSVTMSWTPIHVLKTAGGQ